MEKKQSPRQELGRHVACGNLRTQLEMNPQGLSYEAIDLLVTIAMRYCEPPMRRRKK